ncbi:MAG: efflux RND transporter periplasmic adaptor subunit [Bacteroidales bacterium]|nr:efflux RND transporter periplasmic adaptor subunit [Bacteroidales bacterium]
MTRSISKIVVLGCLGLTSCLLSACKHERRGQAVLETARIERGHMENSVTATGTVEPITQVEVGTQVSGIIDKIFVDYNSRVTANQVIAELDKTVLEQELNSALSDLNSTKNEFEYQEKNFKRTKSLYKKNMISQSSYDEAVYNYNRSKNSYDKAKASYKKAQTNLGYATIYSPIDGVVVSRSVDVGQTVAASFSTPTLFTIANNLVDMQVIADVDEADIGQVAEGMAVQFTVDAFPDDIFHGEVISVRIEPITTNNVVTYEVVINAPNPQEKLKPGMTANVSIYAMRKSGVLLLPLKATRFMPPAEFMADKPKPAMDKPRPERPEGGDSLKIVWVKNAAGAPEMRQVKTGASDGIYYEILDGLQAGDEVFTGVKSGNDMPDMTPKGGESPFMPKRPGSERRSAPKRQ